MPTPEGEPRSADVGWPHAMAPQMTTEHWLDMELGEAKQRIKSLEAEVVHLSQGILVERERAEQAERLQCPDLRVHQPVDDGSDEIINSLCRLAGAIETFAHLRTSDPELGRAAHAVRQALASPRVRTVVDALRRL